MTRENGSLVWSEDIEQKMLLNIAKEYKCVCHGKRYCFDCQYRLTMIVADASLK